jgi:CMP-N-acetylneuraminic acid synthetase
MSTQSKTKIVALVPMRHDSERVPGKNYRDMVGKPLYAHILATLSKVDLIDQIVVDTDSEIVRSGIRQAFPEVLLLDRPAHLREGETPMNEVLLHDTEQVPAEIYLQTHSTNPLLRAETVRKAIEEYLAGIPQYDSLFSVTELRTRLYDDKGQAINHDPGELLRTQDLPPVYEENSCIYLFTRETLEKFGHRIGGNPKMFPIPAEEAQDIDEESDFLLVENILKMRAGH